MSGNNNNIQKSKSPRPIAIAPAPEKPTTSQQPSSASTSTTVGSNGGGGNELNGKRKLAPRPPTATTTVEESVKPLFKIQPKKDSPPTTVNNSNNISSSNGSSSQQKASTPTPSTGQMMTGSFVLRPVSNPNQRMYPFYSSPSAHPHLQQRLQATIDSNGNIIPNPSLTENQLHQLQQQHQRIITLQQQQHQQQQHQRPTAPIPIAPRPTSISSAPSTSEASSSTSVAAGASTPSTSNSKPPKIYPRPIEKKPTTSHSNPSASTPMNIIPPQNIIPTPQLNAAGAIIHFSPNGTPFGYTPHPSAAALNVHLQNQQLSYIQPQGLTRMQMSQINPMSIFPHHPHQQIIHPAYLNAAAAANGNATFISQGIQNPTQMAQFTISGFNPNQIPTSFMNSLQVSQQQQQQQQQFHLQQQQQLQRQHQQQQQNQQRKLIPITAIPSTSIITTLPSTSSATSNPPTLMPRPPPLLPATIPIAPAPIAPEIKLESKIQESTSDDDENEPPPLLDRDETVPASVHEAFVQEAQGVRMQFPAIGTAGNEPLRHFIDGFIIEESSVPFEIDDNIKDPMEFIRQIAKEQKLKKEKEEAAAAMEMEVEKEDIKKNIVKKVKKEKPEKVDKVLKKRGRRSNMEKKNSISSQKSNGNGKNKQKSASPSKSKKRRSSSSTEHQKQQQRRPSPTESIKSPNSERPGSSKGTRKSREIENLIKMDFGPKNQVFKTTSVDEYTKAIKRGQQTSLRPVILQDYKERSPEISREGDEQQCLNCKFTFAQLKLRCEKYPQYCTKECRKKFRKSAREARQEQANAKSADPSSSSSTSNNNNIINEMTAALIGKSSDNSYKEIRKRLSNESEASTISHIPTKSSPLKLRIRSSSDLESPASSSQILSPAPSTSAAAFQMMMMPGPSSTPTTMIQNNINTSNGSIPSIASPPPNGNAPTLSAAATNSNFQHFSRITEELGLNPSDVNSWSAEDVGQWINRITNSQTNGDIFISEEIDGSSLFMLSQNQITTELKVKLGPTLKIVNAIDWLRNL